MTFTKTFYSGILLCLLGATGLTAFGQAGQPTRAAGTSRQAFLQKEFIFPLQKDHVHGSTLVELPDGSLLTAWFQGSGERWADDVQIIGARKKKNSKEWGRPFVLADVKEFPDINPVLFVDAKKRLWLIWYTVIANQWETSLINYRISDQYVGMEGAPKWNWQENLLVKAGDKTERGMLPGDSFVKSVSEQTEQLMKEAALEHPADTAKYRARVEELLEKAKGNDMIRAGRLPDADGNMKDVELGYPYFRRMGWQTRAKPYVSPKGRMILPLYSDGFSFSLMAITDDLGENWKFSNPLVGSGNIQPSIARTSDGVLVAYMRDNGPPPKRLMVSRSTDEGMTWSRPVDSEILNSGTAADVVTLKNGKWALINNQLESGRHILTVSLSEDDGKTWKWNKVIETGEPGSSFHYPAIIEGANGDIHVSYSYFLNKEHKDGHKTVVHGVFNEAWIKSESR